MKFKLIALKTFLLFFLFVGNSLSAEDPNQIGGNISNSLKDYYMKDKNTMNDVLYSPGNDSSKNLQTINGETGKANFNCTSEFPFAQITYYPGAGGDISIVIYEDLNLDGVFEYTNTINGVSGICTTGVITCDSGTTNNCKFVSFSVDTSGKLIFDSPVYYSPDNYPCYFVNSSGNNISSKFPEGVSKILNDLSGLVSNLVSGVKDFIGVVSYKDYQNFTVKLSGTRPSSCISANSDTLNRAKSYYSSGGRDDSTLNSDVDGVKTGTGFDAPLDGVDPATAPGVYEYASTSPSLNSQPPPDLYSCVIRNIISNNVSTEYENCQTISWQGQQWCIVDRAKSNGCISGSVSINTPLDVALKPTQSLVAIFTGSYSICDDDSTTGYLKYSGDFTGNYTFGCELRNGKLVYIANSVNKNKNVTINLFKQVHRGGSSGCDFYDIKLLKSSTYTQDNFSVSSTNNCPVDPNCRIKEEFVCDKDGNNCIKTYSSDGSPPVNLTPICYSMTTQLDTYYICSDGNNITAQSNYGTQTLSTGSDRWFYIKRTYVCENNANNANMPGKDFFNDAANTRESVYTDQNKTDFNFDSSTGEFSYNDYVASQGQVRQGTIKTQDKTCSKVCRVKVLASQKGDISVSSGEAVSNIDPNNSSTLNAKDTMDYVTIRNCENNTCPYDSTNEVLLEDCFCMETDDSIDTESLTGIMGTYESTKDIICSSSPP